MKKIALIIPSLKPGGMERVMCELANFISKDKLIDCYLITLSNLANFYNLNKEVNTIKPDFDFGSHIRFLGIIRTLLFLRNELKRIKPDSILSFGEMYNSFVLLSALGLGMNVFVSDRSKPDKNWGFFHNLLRRCLYPKAKGIISQTSYSMIFLKKETGHNNIKIIPNPVNVQKFKTLQNEKIILTVGRLIKSKGVDILIELFSQLENNEWQLWIVGDGTERKNLENIVKSLKLEEKVKFFGYQNNIEEFYSRASLFAFMSISEGFPNVILEAMATGLPVIAYDCIAGPSDLIVNGETGFLVKVGDTSDFQEKLKLLISNEKLLKSFSEKTKLKVTEFDINIIGKEYLKFILS